MNSGSLTVSIALMQSPTGWLASGQTPEFDEYTAVLDVQTGQAAVTSHGEWVRYSTPDGAAYLAVCIPDFSTETVHRDSA